MADGPILPDDHWFDERPDVAGTLVLAADGTAQLDLRVRARAADHEEGDRG